MFFFFNDTATTEIYTLSLHDALPISTLLGVLDRTMTPMGARLLRAWLLAPLVDPAAITARLEDRKSTRLNSSHVRISYAVFCLKKKKPAQSTRRARLIKTPTVAPTPC